MAENKHNINVKQSIKLLLILMRNFVLELDSF